jgi:hypothetical protein
VKKGQAPPLLFSRREKAYSDWIYIDLFIEVVGYESLLLILFRIV